MGREEDLIEVVEVESNSARQTLEKIHAACTLH